MTILFLNGTANGVSPNVHNSTGGNHVFSVRGTFDGATCTLQLLNPDDPNAQYADVENAALTVPIDKSVEYIPNGWTARAVISGAGASTDIFAGIST
jgi:hypothetical protein